MKCPYCEKQIIDIRTEIKVEKKHTVATFGGTEVIIFTHADSKCGKILSIVPASK